MGNRYEKEIEEIVDRSNGSSITNWKPLLAFYWKDFKGKHSKLLYGIIVLSLIILSSMLIGIEIALTSSIILLLLFYSINKYQKHQNKHQYKKKWRGKEVD